jgi:hypothetical protein
VTDACYNHFMKNDYSEIIGMVCRTDDWRKGSLQERQGALGLAMVISFLKGENPSLEDMSDNLDISMQELDLPFRRLLVNGVFSTSQKLRTDPILLGRATKTWMLPSERTRNAWCHLAGIASGLCGLRE